MLQLAKTFISIKWQSHIEKCHKKTFAQRSFAFIFLQQHSSHTQGYCHLPGNAFKSQSYCRSKDSWKIMSTFLRQWDTQKNTNCGTVWRVHRSVFWAPQPSLDSSALIQPLAHSHSLIKPLLLYQPVWKLPTFHLQVFQRCLPFTVHHFGEMDELTWNNRVASQEVLWSCLHGISSLNVYISSPVWELFQIAMLTFAPDISCEKQDQYK